MSKSNSIFGLFLGGKVTPPSIFAALNRKIISSSGIADPFREIKRQQNALARAIIPELRTKIMDSSNSLMMAIRIAIAGNIIDCAINNEVTESMVSNQVDEIMYSPFVTNCDHIHGTIMESEKILYLADNAGEIFFDRLLIEQLPHERITVAVRGKPVLNDVTREDAICAEMHNLAKVIDNGSDLPGTVLSECSEEFCEYYYSSDLIISKGQGNYETLNERKERLLFLFIAKCKPVAKKLGVNLNTHIMNLSCC